MTSRLLATALAAAMLPGCSNGAASGPVPEPPATVLAPAERAPWGDTVAARVGGLAAHIHDQLHDRHGTVRETPYVARNPAAAAGLRAWYRERLGEEWTAKPLSLPPEEHGFAFTAGDRALAVGWLDPLPDGRVPAITMRYGEPR
jgi:outer membrane murein-binding lipoprotein Lpp